MAAYQSDQQLYRCLDQLFSQMAAQNGTSGDTFKRAPLAFRFRCQNPLAEVLIDGRKRPFIIEFGATNQPVDLDITLQTDALHQILHGELTLTKALGRRLLVPKGPVWKATQLADLFNQAQQLYPHIYAQLGAP